LIQRPFARIESEDIDALIVNQVREGKSIDYKRTLPPGTDSDKKDFLADASSFANTVGGDLLYGIDETGGIPGKVVGLGETNLDAEMRRLDSLLASGLAPRIRYHLRPIKHSSGAKLLLLRIDRSWIGPHRVILGGHDKFYARNSAGKYPLDVTELREAFLLTNTLIDRIRQFRRDRVEEIGHDRDAPAQMLSGAKVVLHLIPLESVASSTQLDIERAYGDFAKLPPIYSMGMNRRINLDGLVTSSPNAAQPSYVQLMRNGIIEAVNWQLLNWKRGDRRVLLMTTFEEQLIKSLGAYLVFLNDFGIDPPIYVFLSMLGASGCEIEASAELGDVQRYPIDREMLLLPEVTVDDYGNEPATILRPLFDLIWNACGYLGSRNYGTDGAWRRP
jgi:hypothetical protein